MSAGTELILGVGERSKFVAKSGGGKYVHSVVVLLRSYTAVAY